MSKPRLIKDYKKLDAGIIQEIKVHYPKGFKRALISFNDHKNKIVTALPYETEHYMLLIKMNQDMAIDIVRNDDDYGDDNILKEEVRARYVVEIEERAKQAEIDRLNAPPEEEEPEPEAPKKATKKGAKKGSTKSTKKPAAKKSTAKKTSTKTSAKKPAAKKSTSKKPTAKKSAAKKPTTKKATAKKPVAKKAAAKKSTAKKPAAKKSVKKKK